MGRWSRMRGHSTHTKMYKLHHVYVHDYLRLPGQKSGVGWGGGGGGGGGAHAPSALATTMHYNDDGAAPLSLKFLNSLLPAVSTCSVMRKKLGATMHASYLLVPCAHAWGARKDTCIFWQSSCRQKGHFMFRLACYLAYMQDETLKEES